MRVFRDSELTFRKQFLNGYYTEMQTPFALAAVIAAGDESEDWLDALNACLDDMPEPTVAYVHEKLPKAKAYVSQRTYILWMAFSAYGWPQNILQYLVNHQANVALRGGLPHGGPGK